MNPEKASGSAKLFTTIGLVVVTAAYGAWQYLGGQSPVPTPATAPTVTAQTPPTTAPVVTTPAQTPAPQSMMTGVSMMQQPMMTRGKFIDGSYTGNATDAFYGIVQVRAVVQGGRLVDVQFLQFPNDRENSIQISNRSLPILKQEAIVAQSAQVDVVSGATQTSEGFVTSLASALALAK